MLSTVCLAQSSFFGAFLYWIISTFKFAETVDFGYLTPEDFLRGRILYVNSYNDETFLTDDDFQRGRSLSYRELYIHSNKQAWVQKNKFHGDIVGKASWKLGHGSPINYVTPVMCIQTQMPLRASYTRERAILARAIQAYHDNTCIKFTPKSLSDRDYLYIGKIDGCFSDVGRAGGRQEISLDDGCIEYDTAIHELMHSVGFWHEHERWDRDDYIDILWQNIDRDAYDQFGRVSLYESDYYNEPYDYYSVMHYDRKSFSKNGGDTMVARRPEMTRFIGKARDFSKIDLKNISIIYLALFSLVRGHNRNPNRQIISVFTFFKSCHVIYGWPLRKINKMYNCPRKQHSITQVETFPTHPPPAVQWQAWQPIQPILQPQPPASQPDPNCQDRATLCWRWVNRCHSPFFEQIMRDFCAQTCGFCFPQGNNLPLSSFFRKRENQ